MASILTHEPDYTCVETIERSQRLKPARKFELLDVLRLEVALVGGKELFAWPGARKFEEGDPRTFIRSGTIGNGYFAMHARAVFFSDAVMFTYGAGEELGGRQAVRYDYRVPLLQSGYHLRSGGREAVVGYHGSLWADPKTLDVLRLTVNADDILVSLEMERADTVIDYARMKIGENQFLLPASADLTLTDLNGSDSRNLMRFTSCRQFAGESVLLFSDPPPDTAAPAAAGPVAEVELPRGLRIEAELDEKIDAEHSAVGDAVRASIHNNVKHAGSILIPKGARLNGRLTRLQHMNGYYAVAIAFAEIEFPGGRAAFSGKLEEVGSGARLGDPFTFGAGGGRFSRLPRMMTRDPSPVPGTFFITGDRLRLPRGFRFVWTTRAPAGANQKSKEGNP